jgi:RimJ/RimL family protein N-acetyltransferase
MTETGRVPIPTVLPVLRGERLLLRAMTDGGAAALFDIYSDPLVMQYTDEPPLRTAEVGCLLRQTAWGRGCILH